MLPRGDGQPVVAHCKPDRADPAADRSADRSADGSQVSAVQDELHVMDRFVTEHKQGVRKSYRVRWVGFPPSEDTIEPLSELRKDLHPDLLKRMQQEFLARRTAAEGLKPPMIPGAPKATAAMAQQGGGDVEPAGG